MLLKQTSVATHPWILVSNKKERVRERQREKEKEEDGEGEG